MRSFFQEHRAIAIHCAVAKPSDGKSYFRNRFPISAMTSCRTLNSRAGVGQQKAFAQPQAATRARKATTVPWYGWLTVCVNGKYPDRGHEDAETDICMYSETFHSATTVGYDITTYCSSWIEVLYLQVW